MAEVDEIILFGLNSINFDVDGQSVVEFDGNLFYKACVSCIKIIQPGIEDIPASLPHATASKFKACTALSQAIKDNGYPEEMGFNSFMYINVEDMRKVLSWLVQNLPQEEGGVEDTVQVSLHQKAMASIDALYDLSSVPVKKQTYRNLKQITMEESSNYQLAGMRELCNQFTIPFLSPSSEEEATYVAEKLPFVCGQVIDPRDFPTSIMEYNMCSIVKERAEEQEWIQHGIHTGMSKKQFLASKRSKVQDSIRSSVAQAMQRYNAPKAAKLMAALQHEPEDLKKGKKSRFMKELNFAKGEETVKQVATDDAPAISEEELAAQRRKEKEAEEARLRDEHQKLETKLAKLDDQLSTIQSEIENAQGEVVAGGDKQKELQEEGAELEQQYETLQRTIEYADDLPGNSKKLEEIRLGIMAEIDEVRTAFEEKQAKYKAQYAAITEEKDKAQSSVKAKLEDIQSMKKKIKNLNNEIQEKEEQKIALEAELAKLPKNIDRETFIRRIMDIIKNIRKQQNEITKINMDNKALQKEINQTNDAVTRSFIATEEKVYQDATKDDVAKQVYKHLVALRDNFDELIKKVEDIGHAKHQQYEYEEKKSALMQRYDEMNMERLLEDLEAIRTENATLQANLKAIKKK